MGKGSAGDIVHSGGYKLLYIVGSNISRAFRFSSSIYKFNGLPHFLYGHIIQHYYIGSCLKSLPYHIKIFSFHLYPSDKRSVFPGEPYRLLYSACSIYMIILKQHAVGKIIAMVETSAHSYGVFFKYPHVRRSLPCVKELHSRAFKQISGLSCVGGNTAHALKVIKSYPLS